MAYSLFLLRYLRCLPMVLSAASLHSSYDQYLFLRPYLDIVKEIEAVGESTGTTADTSHKEIARSQVNVVLAPYIRRLFTSELVPILMLYPAAWVAAGLNLAVGCSTAAALPRTSWYLYAAGLIFSMGRMLWDPRAKDLMERIGGLGQYSSVTDDKDGSKGKGKEDNVALLGQWLRLHTARTLMTDMPGWLCFLAAFVETPCRLNCTQPRQEQI